MTEHVSSRSPGLFLTLAVILLVAVFCCLLLLTAVGYLFFQQPGLRAFSPAAAAQPIVSHDRIVYVDTAGRLHTINPDGSQDRLLSSPELAFRFPAWSPDDSAIAAIGSDGETSGVYLFADSQPAQMRTLYTSTANFPIYLYWSPDGRRLSFLVNEFDRLALWIVEPNSPAGAEAVAFGRPFFWTWDPSGQSLLIHSGGTGRGSRIGFLHLDDDRGIANLALPGFFQAPGISPSGRYMAYAEAVSGPGSRIVVQERDGEQHWETQYHGIAALNWNPVYDRLAFISPENDAPHFYGPLRILDVADGSVRQITGRTVIAFFWSPDGDKLAILSPSQESDTQLGRGPIPVPALHHTQPSPPRLDLILLDTTRGSERPLISFTPTPLFLAQLLPFFDQYALSHRLWSPRGDALVLPLVSGDGRPQIYVIPVDGQLPGKALAEGTIAFWSAAAP